MSSFFFRLFSVGILLIGCCVMGAPAPTPAAIEATSVETFYENVTRTVIHEVTEPTVTKDVPVTKIVTLEEARANLNKIQAELDEARKVVISLDTVPRDETTVAADIPTAVTEATAETNTTTIRQCTCKEADECREQSNDDMETCMTSCTYNIEKYGDKTDEYLKCFNKFNTTIIEAENCLFDNKKDFCTVNKEEKTIDNTNWDEYTTVTYEADKEFKDNAVWKRYEPEYTRIQQFFTCTKNCMHKTLGECTALKGCSVKMPAVTDFEKKMNKCTKKNYKIATALFNTCSCLAWSTSTGQVKELQGTCGYIGGQYYIDRA